MASANLVPSAVKLAAPPVFTFLGNLGCYIARIIYIGFYVLTLVRTLLKHGHRFRFELNRESARELGRFSAGVYVGSIVGGLPQLLLPLIVLTRMGAQQSAYWSIAMTIGALLNQLPLAVTQALLPEISHRPAERRHLLFRSTFLVTGIVVPALLVAYAGAPLLLGVFGHSYTAQIISSLHWLIYSGFVTLMNYATGAILYVAKKSGAIIFVNAVDTIITVGMAAIWATSSTGVAIGYFAGDAASTVLFAVCAFLALREVGGRFEALGGDQVPAGAYTLRVPGALQQAFDLLSAISDQQRLAAVQEVAGHNVTEPQGLYSVLALRDAEAERQRRRQRQAQGY
jgi:O-antigen/teichoic acid export membrane protein